nr:DUF6527 family protein [uncultured Arsenicibacter sp.]
MKTLKKVSIEPVFVEFIPEVLEPGKLYISRHYRTSTHSCFCGCGHKVVLPFTENFWQLTEKNGKVSISPSVGNYNLPCRSHYIITGNVANFV